MKDLLLDDVLIEEAINDLVTLGDWIRFAASQFNHAGIYYGHGTDNAWDEARALVMPTLALPFDAPQSVEQCRLTASEKRELGYLIQRRINERIPTAYLTNQAWFAGMPFYVDERVLVPRSPFAQLILDKFARYITTTPTHILDLCTGSGCIAIALAEQFPDAQVDALDLSLDALEVADINIQEHQLSHRVFPLQSDLFDAVAGQQYDLIVSNPPYVDAEDLADMPEEYHHEPEMGLGSGDDGLDITRRIIAQAADHLTDNGLLFVEVGNSQVHMEQAFPGLALQWLPLAGEGQGIFMVSKADLLAYARGQQRLN